MLKSYNSVLNPLPQHWNLGTVSDNFYNVPKSDVRQAPPLYAAIGQVCGGEKVCKICSLSSPFSFFPSFFRCTANCNIMNDLMKRLSKSLHCYHHLYDSLHLTPVFQHFCFQKWSENMLHESYCSKHTEPFTVRYAAAGYCLCDHQRRRIIIMFTTHPGARLVENNSMKK